MTFLDALVTVLTATIGTLGFSLLFSVPRRRLFYATFSGTVSIVGYLVAGMFSDSELVCNLIGMVAAATYVEIMARVTRCPVTLYLIPSTVPLIPGGGLYYTMFYIVEGNVGLAAAKGKTIVVYTPDRVGTVSCMVHGSATYTANRQVEWK